MKIYARKLMQEFIKSLMGFVTFWGMILLMALILAIVPHSLIFGFGITWIIFIPLITMLYTT